MLTRGPGLSAERRARKRSRLLGFGAEEVGLGHERSGRVERGRAGVGQSTCARGEVRRCALGRPEWERGSGPRGEKLLAREGGAGRAEVLG